MPDPACSPFALSLRKQSSQYRWTIGEYLNWDIEAYTLPWMAFCAGLSINPPLSKHLRHMVGVLSMKQLDMLKDYAEVYDAFLSLPVSPSRPWTKGRRVREYRHAWWTDLVTIKLDRRFLTTYPDGHEVKECVTAHFAQMFEGDALLATIHAEAREEGEYLLKMLEDKVLEAKMVAATMLRLDTALGDDVLQAITASDKLVKYLKKEATE
ncbi:uncharacterized protein HD556DRAFT_1448957 [Suillus plorans]|uniref:Uncharacterized protein n=1 Tax=Suillus plorans TaxID=116603 RepID=A0A9P7DCH8_9AGAM|nr:uncharacterized protein HD556DRAFT_1448957 [Suillus plorans]KAG1787298.1 hypothetical protein HD556DRAFT_1448957 [Suillus plorans]